MRVLCLQLSSQRRGWLYLHDPTEAVSKSLYLLRIFLVFANFSCSRKKFLTFYKHLQEWKKFWFVLDGSTLQYSKDQFETQPEFIDLTQSTTASESQSDRNYSFLVQVQ